MTALNRILRRRTVPGKLRKTAFNPASLFANGEQGWWYDPSNFATLFQDSAGTTPVTAVEQPVGLQLDLSKGLVLGPELVVNGDFSNGATGWSVLKGSVIFSTSGATFASGVDTAIRQNISLVSGRSYQVTFNLLDPGNFGVNAIFSGVSVVSQTFVGTGNKSAILFNTTAITRIDFDNANNNFAGTIDNISVKELPGNHRFQTTSANRPVVSARVNLLTKTEQFDDAVWTKTQGTIAANSTVAPDGTTTADTFTTSTIFGLVKFATSPILAAGSFTQGVSFRRGNNDWVVFYTSDGGANYVAVWVNTATGALGTVTAVGTFSGVSATVTPQANSYYRVNLAFTKLLTAISDTFSIRPVDADASFTAVIGSTVVIWGADLRPTNQGVNLPAYQRVNTSTDYDSSGFPIYIKPNGSNQWLQTNSINFSSTDKMTVWQGARKLSAVTGLVYETSVNNSLNNGSISSFIDGGGNGTNTIDASLKGSASQTYFSCGTFPPPITYVQSVIFDIAGADRATEIIPRINGVLNQTGGGGAANTGTGNFGNYPAYFYMRAGISNAFNGHDYGSIARGAASTAAQIAAAEAWINQRTKAF